MQEFCPVHRVEFVPGPRNDEQLAAPEVKFVRKKLKKKTASPLSVITDLLAPHSNEEDGQETPLAATRPVEKRSPGQVGDQSLPKASAVDMRQQLEGAVCRVCLCVCLCRGACCVCCSARGHCRGRSAGAGVKRNGARQHRG